MTEPGNEPAQEPDLTTITGAPATAHAPDLSDIMGTNTIQHAIIVGDLDAQ